MKDYSKGVESKLVLGLKIITWRQAVLVKQSLTTHNQSFVREERREQQLSAPPSRRWQLDALSSTTTNTSQAKTTDLRS